MLSSTKEKYWLIELKMTELIWVIRKLRLMIISCDHFIIVYIDHAANSTITRQTKLSSSSVDKLNLRLVWAFMYLSQFRLDVRHKFEKSHIVLDILSRLLSRQKSNNLADSLDIESFHISLESSKTDLTHAYQDALIEMSENFWNQIKTEYIKNKT